EKCADSPAPGCRFAECSSPRRRCPVEFSVIAVALDFSASSLAALRRARALSARGATLRLIHVVDSAVFDRGPSYGDPHVLEHLHRDLLGAAEKELEALAEEPRVQGANVELAVRIGRPADEILRAAEGSELLVSG